jgi:hypothetical protein
MPSVNWLKLQTCKKERTKKYSSNLVMSGKKFCTKTQKRREETFLPLFSVSGGPYTILLARPLKCLRLSILVHNLYCHHFGTRKVESAVYPRSKVRQNSSMVEKIWRLFKIWERGIRFIPAQATCKKTVGRCRKKEVGGLLLPRQKTLQKLSWTLHKRTSLLRIVDHFSTQWPVSEIAKCRYRQFNIHLSIAVWKTPIYLKTREIVY